MKNTKQLIDSIRGMAGTAKFVSFTYRSKSANELARHTLILGFSYHNLVEKSKLALELMTIPELIAAGVNPTLASEAKDAILKSLNKTLTAHANGEQNEDYTKRNLYVSLGNGLNLNPNDNTLQLFGLAHSKVVIEPGTYPKVNSRPLTIAKDAIDALLPRSKFREFSLENLKSARINGETLELE